MEEIDSIFSKISLFHYFYYLRRFEMYSFDVVFHAASNKFVLKRCRGEGIMVL